MQSDRLYQGKGNVRPQTEPGKYRHVVYILVTGIISRTRRSEVIPTNILLTSFLQ